MFQLWHAEALVNPDPGEPGPRRVQARAQEFRSIGTVRVARKPVPLSYARASAQKNEPLESLDVGENVTNGSALGYAMDLRLR